MTIEKNEKAYSVVENKASWTLATMHEKTKISYNVSKELADSFEALQDYVMSSNLF